MVATPDAREAPPDSVLRVIVNPAAGNGRAGKRWPAFSAALAQHGFITETHFTRGPGDATRIARELAAAGAPTVVCVGGDGTLNEIVNGLVGDDGPVNPATRLALIPCGTGKDFARSLGLRDADAALRAIDIGHAALVDVARVSYLDERSGQTRSRCFINVADCGLGAETAARINRSSKALGGFVAYLTGAVRTIATFKFLDATVTVDGAQLHAGQAGIVVLSNGRYFGGGMLIGPTASPCDGLLDVFVLADVGKRRLLTSLLPRVYRGKHVGQPGVAHRLGARVEITSRERLLVEMDGEQVGAAPLTVEVVPRALRVIGLPDALERLGGCVDAAP